MMKRDFCTGYEPILGMSRRRFLQTFGMGFGSLAFADLNFFSTKAGQDDLHIAHFSPRAKRVIFLFQSGGPSQLDLYDHKPILNLRHGKELPDSVRRGQRLTAMSGNQASLPMAGSPFEFRRQGQSGNEFSEILPHISSVADDLCIIRSMHTEAINHGPGVTFMQTGAQFPGRPSIGAWLNYGLGKGSQNLPSFVVLITKGKGGQPLLSRLWGSGFLPTKHQGVRFRSGRDLVLYLNNPPGINEASRRNMLDHLKALHKLRSSNSQNVENRIVENENDEDHEIGNHEIGNQIEDHDSHDDQIEDYDSRIENRIEQYEMAFQMQRSIPEVADFSQEPSSVLETYGEAVRQPGSFASNCLLARRLAERGVRFIQLYHQGWDQHGGLEKGIRQQCSETDQASAALIKDLKRRGMLDETLVIWGGEFGRTNYCQGKLTKSSFGRDHHPKCFTIWMAGGGVKPGMTFGKTDDFGYNVVKGGVSIHDLHATILHLIGIHHEKLTFKYQGRQFRLTDVHGQIIKPILA